MTDSAPWLQEMTAEAEEKLAALKPAERQFALKRAARLRAGTTRPSNFQATPKLNSYSSALICCKSLFLNWLPRMGISSGNRLASGSA